MKRFTATLVLAGWLAAVTWYWWNFVPLAATSKVRTSATSQLGISPSNELMLAHMRYTDSSRTRIEPCGPIEFWSFPELWKTHEFLHAGDRIISGPSRQDGDILVRRAGQLVLLNAYTRETLAAFPDLPEAMDFARIPGKQEVLIAERNDVHLFAFDQETPRWTAPMFSIRGKPAGGFVSVSKRFKRNAGNSTGTVAVVTLNPANATLLNLESGEPDHRFDHLGKVVSIRLSSDGRSAIVQMNPDGVNPFRTVVCDVETAQIRWKMPSNVVHGGFIFAANDQEIHATVISPARIPSIHRWRTGNGESLGELKPGATSPLVQNSSDGRYGFWYSAGRNADTPLKHTADRINNFLGANGVRFYLDLGEPRPHVRDVRTEQVLGPLPEKSQNSFLRNDHGLVSFAYPHIRYYRLPPHRDYWWLAGWALLPPAIVVLLARIWPRRKSMTHDH